MKRLLEKLEERLKKEYTEVNVSIQENGDNLNITIECKNHKDTPLLIQKLDEEECDSIPGEISSLESHENPILSAIYDYVDSYSRYESFKMGSTLECILYDYLEENEDKTGKSVDDFDWEPDKMYNKNYWRQFKNTNEIVEALEYLENKVECLNFRIDW